MELLEGGLVPFRMRGKRWPYAWEVLTDGKAYSLTKGVDYAHAEHFRNAAHQYASRHGLRATVVVLGRGGTVHVQFRAVGAGGAGLPKEYSWEALSDGAKHELVQGVHYQDAMRFFGAATEYADSRGLHAEVRFSKIGLSVQFTPTNGNAPTTAPITPPSTIPPSGGG